MISRSEIISKLRSLGLSYRNRTRNGELYRGTDPLRRIVLSRRKSHTEDYARIILRQAGMKDSEIDEFLESTTGETP